MNVHKIYTTPFLNPALLIIRLWLGVVMLRYSSMYLFGGKITGLIDFLTSLNWPMPHVMAYTSQIMEFVAAILILLGVRLGAVMLACTMLTAVLFAHQGLVFTEAETPFNYFVFAAILSLTGMGKPALDQVFKSK